MLEKEAGDSHTRGNSIITLSGHYSKKTLGLVHAAHSLRNKQSEHDNDFGC